VLGSFVGCPFVSAFSLCCRRWGWFVMDAVFVLDCKLLARLLASRLATCVVVFPFYASADARWCARRLLCRKLVPFCSFEIVVAIFVVLVSVRCVLWCVGCLKGAVVWLVGGPKLWGS